MTNDRYNGYRNYETWCIALWIANEESTYRMWRRRAMDLVRDEGEGDESDEDQRSDTTRNLADEIKTWVEAGTPEVSGFYADLLNAAIGEVDWLEVAEEQIDGTM
jgi:hypothetical protein